MKLSARAWFRKWHKWPSLVLSVFVLLFALSGIVLNHRKFFSSCDVSRNLVPGIYRYNNWNLAAVKGSVKAGTDELYVFGNIGIWKTDTLLVHFADFNQGFPKGIDERKINSLLVTQEGDFYAGTLFGLYFRGKNDAQWMKVRLPIEEERIVKVLMVKDELYVMSRSSLLKANPAGINSDFFPVNVAEPADYDNKTGLFRTLWVIHSGEIYGIIGRYFVDFVAIVFIFLTLSGIYHFITPYLLKRAAEKGKARLRSFFRFNLRWHNRSGSCLILILLLTTLTGIFLRPPLLIAIANSRVGKIPYSLLANPNPWNDKFRDILYEDSLNRVILATSEGIYYSDDDFKSLLKHFTYEPQISVMGINVFQAVRPGEYLVGSFSGLFRWFPEAGYVEDYITKEVKAGIPESGKPFGNNTVAGYIRQGNREIIFDYAKGAMVFKPKDALPVMPQQIVEASPMSLWSVCLEIHTCRIYEFLIGDFYVLLIPLIGLGMAFLLVTGWMSWYKGRR